jgi:hypothetical protein
MPVYAFRMINDMHESLRRLAEQFYMHTQLALTPDDFIAAFIAPEHVTKLKEVQDLIGASGMSSTSTSLYASGGHACKVYVQFYGTSPVILPQYVRNGLQPTCPEELRERITTWVDQRLEYGQAFGDTIDAISYLNDECGDLRAMSLMLPCIGAIMANVSDDGESPVVKRARKLSEQTRFGRLPSLPPPVKQRLGEISALVNATTLVKDAVAPHRDAGTALLQFNNTAAPVRANMFWTGEHTSGSAYPTASFI